MTKIDLWTSGEAVTATKMNQMVNNINELEDIVADSFVTKADTAIDLDITNLTKPVYYDYSNEVSSLAIKLAALPFEVTLKFKVSSSITTATLPMTFTGSTPYVIGDKLDFEALKGETYELSIRNGIMTLGDVQTLTT